MTETHKGHVLTSALLGALLWLCACGPVMYNSAVSKAEGALEQAREQNAHWYAPYEYHFAQAHLDKAYEEAAHAEYEDAVRFAKTARDYADRALRMAARQRIEER